VNILNKQSYTAEKE